VKIGLHGINVRAYAEPGVLARSARLAEEAGIESLWAADHVALPDPRTPIATFDPDDAILDAVVALAWAAAATSTIRLATGVLILPLRTPAVLAKQLATVDVLCGGRLVVGIGIGDLEAEFAACGADLRRRGAVADEHLEALRLFWADPGARGVDARPRPLQSPVPVVVAGQSRAALRRAARAGQGWFGWGQDPERAAECVETLAKAAVEQARPADLGPVEVTVAPPPEHWTPESVAAYGAAGVHRLVHELPADPAALPATLAGIAAVLREPA
jgi:probable F420-dependent oxidoreductase